MFFSVVSAKTSPILLFACMILEAHLSTHLASLALTAEVPKSQTHALKQSSLSALYVVKNDRKVSASELPEEEALVAVGVTRLRGSDDMSWSNFFGIVV